MDGVDRAGPGLPDGAAGRQRGVLRRPGAGHRSAGAPGGCRAGRGRAGGDLQRALGQRFLHEQQRLRIRPGAAGRLCGAAAGGRRQAVAG